MYIFSRFWRKKCLTISGICLFFIRPTESTELNKNFTHPIQVVGTLDGPGGLGGRKGPQPIDTGSRPIIAKIFFGNTSDF